MRTQYQQLQALIDRRDAGELRVFLQGNPELDLNNITPSGVSALWYALTPPSGKNISASVISTLIATNRINPTLRYNDELRWQDVWIPRDIIYLIQTYEDEYRAPAPAPNLAFVNYNAQNTHDTAIVTAMDEA